MGIEEIKQKIADQEQDIEAKTKHLDKLAAEIVITAQSFFQEWYVRQVRDAVKSNPENAKAIGKDRLADMKAQVSEIVVATPHNVEQALSDPEVWTHRAKAQPNHEQMRDYKYGQENCGITLDSTLRRLTATIGNILHAYGLTDTSDRGGLWKLRRFNQAGEQQCEYAINFTHLSPLETMIGKYKSAVTEWWNNRHALQELKRQYDEAEALDLYDSL